MSDIRTPFELPPTTGNFNRVPSDILTLILDTKIIRERDIKRLTLTSKRFLSYFLNTEQFWKQRCLNVFLLSHLHTFPTYLQAYQRLRRFFNSRSNTWFFGTVKWKEANIKIKKLKLSVTFFTENRSYPNTLDYGWSTKFDAWAYNNDQNCSFDISGTMIDLTINATFDKTKYERREYTSDVLQIFRVVGKLDVEKNRITLDFMEGQTRIGKGKFKCNRDRVGDGGRPSSSCIIS